jgi:hypothetical protein
MVVIPYRNKQLCLSLSVSSTLFNICWRGQEPAPQTVANTVAYCTINYDLKDFDSTSPGLFHSYVECSTEYATASGQMFP